MFFVLFSLSPTTQSHSSLTQISYCVVEPCIRRSNSSHHRVSPACSKPICFYILKSGNPSNYKTTLQERLLEDWIREESRRCDVVAETLSAYRLQSLFPALFLTSICYPELRFTHDRIHLALKARHPASNLSTSTPSSQEILQMMVDDT